ncbi:MAG: hypothetical protein P8Y97_11930 [Candidatus Lokiarchaeota archaeon]
MFSIIQIYLEENNLPFIEVEIIKNFKDSISESLGIKEGDLYKPKFPATYSEYAGNFGLYKSPSLIPRLSDIESLKFLMISTSIKGRLFSSK